MSYENVKKYFDQAGLGDRVVVREHIGDTELEKFAVPECWIDVCKGWFVNEN
ncbi:hypothetical protein ACQRBN_04760 [Bariatricus sp. SGI.154]|uniref:hypothetical protein n=1 Tax=Bariatricus sp. SGI.154 TaxID=3420549 RepID=UPI003D002C37